MGPNGCGFPCRVGGVILSYFEGGGKFDLGVLLNHFGNHFEGFLKVKSDHKSDMKKHVF